MKQVTCQILPNLTSDKMFKIYSFYIIQKGVSTYDLPHYSNSDQLRSYQRFKSDFEAGCINWGLSSKMILQVFKQGCDVEVYEPLNNKTTKFGSQISSTFSLIRSLLRPLLWLANVPSNSHFSTSLLIWAYRFELVKIVYISKCRQ